MIHHCCQTCPAGNSTVPNAWNVSTCPSRLCHLLSACSPVCHHLVITSHTICLTRACCAECVIRAITPRDFSPFSESLIVFCPFFLFRESIAVCDAAPECRDGKEDCICCLFGGKSDESVVSSQSRSLLMFLVVVCIHLLSG